MLEVGAGFVAVMSLCGDDEVSDVFRDGIGNYERWRAQLLASIGYAGHCPHSELE
jgi:hypothetical protein